MEEVLRIGGMIPLSRLGGMPTDMLARVKNLQSAVSASMGSLGFLVIEPYSGVQEGHAYELRKRRARLPVAGGACLRCDETARRSFCAPGATAARAIMSNVGGARAGAAARRHAPCSAQVPTHEIRHAFSRGRATHDAALGQGDTRPRRSDLSASTRVASEVSPNHAKSGANALAEQFDEMFRGRSGTEAKPHAVTHMFERPGGGLPFQFIHGHAKDTSAAAADRASGNVRRGAYLASFYREEQRYTSA